MMRSSHRLSAFLRIPISRREVFARAAHGALLICATSAALSFGGSAAHSGPCTTQISQVEQKVAALQAAPPPSGAGEPTAPQSVGAQLHRQPTPGSVQGAERTANTDADTAMERARKADAAGDANGCAEALMEAKRLYGID
jgi:hypothetical protein